jgi:hypothetical protein
MCTSMLAPKPPSMPAAPPPVVAQDIDAQADLDEQEAVFNPGSELDDMSMASATTSKKQGKSSLKTHDTGLAIPL